MANPKWKMSRSRTRKRRSHLRLALPSLVKCPHCHEPKLPHRVCTSCGQYGGRQVFDLEPRQRG